LAISAPPQDRFPVVSFRDGGLARHAQHRATCFKKKFDFFAKPKLFAYARTFMFAKYL